MTKKRLIVSLLYRDGIIIQSRKFQHTNAVGSMQIAIEFFNVWEADEIVILNISRNDIDFDKFVQDIRNVSKSSFLPLTIGGWVHNLERAKALFDNGADKIVVNTKLFNDKNFFDSFVSKYGSQALTASIDAKCENGDHIVYVDRGRISTGITATEWAKEIEKRGAGEIYLTSIDQDGMKNGYDLKLMKKVSENVNIPVIAFGGIQDFIDMVKCLKQTNISAVAAGNVFHYFEQSTRIAKKTLLDSGIDVRKAINYFKY